MGSALTKLSGLSLRDNWRTIVLLATLAFLVGLGLWLFAPSRPALPANPPQLDRDLTSLSQSAFEEATGVRVTLVAVTGQGGLIDLRYQVIDPDKAAIVHDPEKPPTIVDEATGQAFDKLWMQHGHSGELDPGATYYLILVNPQGGVKSGDLVSVLIGNFRLEHVRVK